MSETNSNQTEDVGIVFVKTPQIEKIIRAVNTTVKNDGWMAVTGGVGTGKSTLTRHLVNGWLNEPAKYAVIYTMSWKLMGSRVRSLMKRMIRQISPDEHVPGDIELRAERLKTVLMRAARAKRNVILVLDEAQDLSEASILELKKIHEISAMGRQHLFSIIMFGKQEGRLEEIFSRREIGFRVKQLHTAYLSNEEMISFAEDRFGLIFPKGRERARITDYFCQIVHNSPLGIEAFRNRLEDINGFDGTVTEEHIRAAARSDMNAKLRSLGISRLDVAKEANVSKATATEILNGKDKKYATQAVQAVQAAADRLITRQLQAEQAQ